MGKKKERIRELELEVDSLCQDLYKVQADLANLQYKYKDATEQLKKVSPEFQKALQQSKDELYNEGFRMGKSEAKDDFIYWLGVVLGSPWIGRSLEDMKAEVSSRLDIERKKAVFKL